MSPANSWRACHIPARDARAQAWAQLSTLMALHLADTARIALDPPPAAPAAPGMPREEADDAERARDWLEMLRAVSLYLMARQVSHDRPGSERTT